ncbi:MAG: thioredoxin family protein [Proteobacteria bacterium]|nr:MAG: thioredoxin family protein [Pseudomonadota bacterium]
MEIKIYGSGCSKCVKLAQNAGAAIEKLGITASITKVTDTNAIIDAGVVRTPALVIDDDVKVVGRVATAEEIETMLKGAP